MNSPEIRVSKHPFQLGMLLWIALCVVLKNTAYTDQTFRALAIQAPEKLTLPRKAPAMSQFRSQQSTQQGKWAR